MLYQYGQRSAPYSRRIDRRVANLSKVRQFRDRMRAYELEVRSVESKRTTDICQTSPNDY
eukprot:2609176-Rhodomonas_salina.1